MSSDTSNGNKTAVAELETPEETTAITARLIVLSMVTGLFGVILMSPLLLGVPVALGVFRAEPLVEFASIGSFFGVQTDLIGPILGLDPSLILGGLLFTFGGVLFLPVQFLVVGSFLPPESPRYVRGVTFSVLWWIGFLFAFWPGGSAATIALFCVVSLVSHLIYGLTLGRLVDRWGEIPQHRV